MGSGEDAGALASPAQETGDDRPAAGAEDAGPVAAAGDDAPVAGAGDKAPVADEPGAAEPAASDGDLPGPVPAPEEPGHNRGAPVWVAGMAALLAVLIAGIVVAVVFLGHVNSSDTQNSRRQAAVAAARTAATDLTAADYQHPQEYIGKLKGVATGNFLKLITNSSSGFASVLAQGKVQTSGRVVDVGVQKIGTDTAQLSVLAYVTVKNSQSPNGSERAYRLSVSMISAGSRWLVSNVEFVQ
jgi:Mce-associated membrane protein